MSYHDITAWPAWLCGLITRHWIVVPFVRESLSSTDIGERCYCGQREKIIMHAKVIMQVKVR